MSGSSRPFFDVAVVGGGPAGSATALALAGRGIRVCLVEQSRHPVRKVCGEFLSSPGLEILRRLTDLDPEDFPRIDAVRFSRPGEQGLLMPVEPPGKGIRRGVMDEALLRSCRQAGVEVGRGVRGIVPSAVPAAGAAQAIGLVSAAGVRSTLSCRWLVLATGRPAVMRGRRDGPRSKRSAQDWIGLKSSQPGIARPGEVEITFFDDGSYFGRCPVDGGGASACGLVRPESALRMAGGKEAGGQPPPARGTPRFHLGLQAPRVAGAFPVGDALAVWPPIMGDGITVGLISGLMLGSRLSDAGFDAEAWLHWWRLTFGQALRENLWLHSLLTRTWTRARLLDLVSRHPAPGAWLARRTRRYLSRIDPDRLMSSLVAPPSHRMITNLPRHMSGPDSTAYR